MKRAVALLEAQGVIEKGISLQLVETKKELVQKIKNESKNDCVILCKASRSVGLDEVVDALVSNRDQNEEKLSN